MFHKISYITGGAGFPPSTVTWNFGGSMAWTLLMSASPGRKKGRVVLAIIL